MEIATSAYWLTCSSAAPITCRSILSTPETKSYDVERGGRGSRVAGSEDEPVDIGAARHGVTAEPALEFVVSRTGRQDVVADIAAQRVHRVVAEDPVVEVVAVGIGGGRRIDGHVFDIAFVGELPASRGNDLVAPDRSAVVDEIEAVDIVDVAVLAARISGGVEADVGTMMRITPVGKPCGSLRATKQRSTMKAAQTTASASFPTPLSHNAPDRPDAAKRPSV